MKGSFPSRLLLANHPTTSGHRLFWHSMKGPHLPGPLNSQGRRQVKYNIRLTSSGRGFQIFKTVFGTEFTSPLQYMADIPADPGPPTLAEDEKDKIIHVELPNLGGLLLMGTDMLESMGHELLVGDNISLNLEADTRTETVRLYKALSEGRKADSPLQDMLWGGYFGTCAAKFGVRWMFNCAAKE